jgi:signal transduction histidine kinase
VEDNGDGISDEYLEKIFLPFFQVPGSEKKDSTGLGLDSVRELVKLHGGKTWAESKGPGTGSKFIVQIPKKK